MDIFGFSTSAHLLDDIRNAPFKRFAFLLFQEHEKRCWSVDFNLMDPKLLASGSDDAKGS